MRTNTTLALMIGVLAVLGLVLAFVVSRPEQPRSPLVNQFGEPTGVVAVVEAFSTLARVQPLTPPDDRVALVGGSLFTAERDALGQRVELVLGWPLERVVTDGMTSVDALTAVAQVLVHPPKLMVLDLGRDDASAGVTIEQTTTALRELVAKASGLGVKVVVLGGVGTDGNDRLATIVTSAVSPTARFIDASPWLLDAAYRINPATLNARGVEQLGNQVVATLQELRGS